LWAERQAQRAAEPRPPPLSASQQRELGVSIAQEVARSERARLFWWGDTSDSTPFGLRLLELIPDPGQRFAAGVATAAVFLGTAAVAFTASGHPTLRGVCGAIAVALFAMFTPSTRRRRRFWDWFD
jgi:hypothetical protein